MCDVSSLMCFDPRKSGDNNKYKYTHHEEKGACRENHLKKLEFDQ
jgi:hypothetical protein